MGGNKQMLVRVLAIVMQALGTGPRRSPRPHRLNAGTATAAIRQPAPGFGPSLPPMR